jgi:FKBP-type peptidyl-prolyl cis-trans isomerase
MKTVLKLIVAAWGVILLAAPAGAQQAQFSKNKKDMQCYAMGVEMLKDFNRQGFDFDLDMVTKGMKDAAAGGKLLWSEEIIKTTQHTTLGELRQKRGDTAGLSRQELNRKWLIAQQDNEKRKREQLLAENKAKEGEETQLSKKKREMQSYAMGVEMLRNFNRQGVDYDLDMVIKGLEDAAAGSKLLWSEETLTAAQSMTVAELKYKRGQARQFAQQNNKKAGEEFLAGNKTREGLVELPCGLQYRILQEGSGRRPTESDTVELRYRGAHIDGTEFEDSGPTDIPTIVKKVSEVIPGWREALKLMSVGSKWQLFIPSELAYGQRGAGRIGPYETTIYEIELVDIK